MLDSRVSPREMFSSFWRNHQLIFALVKRDILGRYQGSVLGLLWSIFIPFFMLIIYTFVFSYVFKARWTGLSESKIEFALILFSGLLVFNLFAECVTRAPSIIVNNVNYVKKIMFPIEILPLVSLGSALFSALMSLAIWVIFYCIYFGAPPITILLLPLIVLPLLFLIVGVSWLMSALGVYLRDISQIMSICITGLMFISPVFYPVSSLPNEYQFILKANPLTPIIEQVRDAMIWGKQPDWQNYFILLFVAITFAWLAFVCFQRFKREFADVL